MLHVAEAGLRSTLVARLTLGGADVLTMRELTAQQPPPASRGKMVLVIDDAGVHAYPGASNALYEDSRWTRLVMLTGAEPPDPAPAHVHHLAAASAAPSLGTLLDEWHRAD